MLEQQFNAKPETREILQKIEQQTFRASKIINTLLDLSREQPAEIEKIDINGLLHETLLLLKPHFKDLPIEIVQEFDSSNPAVSGNEGKLATGIHEFVFECQRCDAARGTLAGAY